MTNNEWKEDFKSFVDELQMPRDDYKGIMAYIDECPVNDTNGWISVKNGLPKEHPSIFAEMYGTEKWRSGMWRTESDRVLVTIKFPDNTRTVDKGRLQDGTWRTGVSPVLPQEVTHWAVWPEPAEEEMQK